MLQTPLNRLVLFFALAALCSEAVDAAPPQPNEFLLYARTNFSVNPGGSFNIQPDAFVTSSTVVLNNNGNAAIKVSALSSCDCQAVWYGNPMAGGIVYFSPTGSFIGNVSMDVPEVIVFSQTFSSPDGIFYYDVGANMSGLETDQPLGASGWGSPTINVHGEIGYDASFVSDSAWVSWNGTSTDIHATEAALDVSSPYSFLFTPSFNDSGLIAGKARLGAAGQIDESQPDQIISVDDSGQAIILLQDMDSDPASNYLRFDNGLAFNDLGQVAVVAGLAGNIRAVVFYDGADDQVIAREGVSPVGEIDFFAPTLNNNGLVAFRGHDDAGLRSLFLADTDGVVRVIGEHDLVDIDLGSARLDQHDGSEIFGGALSLNDNNELAFVAGLTPPDDNQTEWGSGIFVARSGDLIFADSLETPTR